jgi:hypothetical protein
MTMTDPGITRPLPPLPPPDDDLPIVVIDRKMAMFLVGAITIIILALIVGIICLGLNATTP